MKTVIYLTGASGTGKTTLCGMIADRLGDSVVVYSYSDLLLDTARRRGQQLRTDELRQRSSSVITPEDVEATDSRLIESVEGARETKNVIVDSHPVTREEYGIRITSFSPKTLKQLSPDKVFCLYANPEVLVSRIAGAPGGRRIANQWDVQYEITLQASIAAQYAFQVGVACYLLDSTASLDSLLAIFLQKANLDP